MCYPGQNFDMSVPVPEGERSTRSACSTSPSASTTSTSPSGGSASATSSRWCAGVRLVARGTTPKPDRFAELGTVTDASEARKGYRAAYFGVDFVDTPVYDGPRARSRRRGRRVPR